MTIPSSAPRQQGPAAGARRARRLLGVCAIASGVAVLAACTNSASSSASGGQPTSPGSSASATPVSPAKLKTIVLQSADLPAGWKGTPHQPDPNDSADDAALAQCVGARDTEADKVANADSDDFANGDASISSNASSFKSQSDLDSDLQMLHNPKISSCFEQMMRRELTSSLPSGSTVETASIKITPGSGGGPSNVIATGTGTIKVTAQGQQVPVYLTVAFIAGPLIEARVTTVSSDSPVPSSVVNPLVAAVANRAAQG